MNTLIEKNRIDIQLLCKAQQVETLFLFGSAANDDAFTPSSDIDFIFTYKKDKEGLPLSPFDYFDFLFSLEKLLGRKVDLVAKEKIKNRYFSENVNKQMVKLYG